MILITVISTKFDANAAKSIISMVIEYQITIKVSRKRNHSYISFTRLVHYSIQNKNRFYIGLAMSGLKWK